MIIKLITNNVHAAIILHFVSLFVYKFWTFILTLNLHSVMKAINLRNKCLLTKQLLVSSIAENMIDYGIFFQNNVV